MYDDPHTDRVFPNGDVITYQEACDEGISWSVVIMYTEEVETDE